MSERITISIRMPKEINQFLRKRSFEAEVSINQLIVNCLESYKNNYEKQLASCDVML